MPNMVRLIEEIHPGEILLEGFIKPMGISARQLAADIDVSPRIRVFQPAGDAAGQGAARILPYGAIATCSTVRSRMWCAMPSAFRPMAGW